MIPSPPDMPRLPLRNALSAARDSLDRCETLARELRNHLHGDQPSGTAGFPIAAVTLPPAHPGANEIAQRLSALGDMLSELCSSF